MQMLHAPGKSLTVHYLNRGKACNLVFLALESGGKQHCIRSYNCSVLFSQQHQIGMAHRSWSLAFTLYIGSFPYAQLPGPVHTARLGRVFFCVHI